MYRPGQLARPKPIGNDWAGKISETRSDISGAYTWSCKYKKLIDLQIFSRIDKTLKKLYELQKLPQTSLYLDLHTYT